MKFLDVAQIDATYSTDCAAEKVAEQAVLVVG